MTVARTGLYVWVTWLAKLMAGEVQCHWAPWFRTHYMGFNKAPSDFQQAAWVMAHNQCLDELCRECSSSKVAIFKEDQNQFRVTRKSGLVVSGKPDLITLDEGASATVYDIKTGTPRHSDIVQVMLYMLFLPYGSPVYKGKKISGCVVYKDGEHSVIPSSAIDLEFQKRVTYFLDLLETGEAPRRSPSVAECRYCDLTSADCPEKCESQADDRDGNSEVPF
ncbi:hypothetical protein DGWBC_1477 [Dehalogenimonas sp. WBC-2]|nr:hypothetical protein DGWBC_1477 [Dehalogenimonas sp. WBC-2]